MRWIKEYSEQNTVNLYLMSNSAVEFVHGSVRKRVSKACDHCRKRKIKCGAIDPSAGKCSNCMKFETICTFDHHNEMERQRRAFEKERFTAEDKKVRKSAVSQVDQANSVEQKLGKMQQELSALVEYISRGEDLSSSESWKSVEPRIIDRTSSPKRKRYTTSLLTKRKIAWLKEQATATLVTKDNSGKNSIPDTAGVVQTFIPLKEILVTSSKWYVVQLKKLIDCSSPWLSSCGQLYPLPSEELCNRILEAFRTKIFADGFNIVQSKDLDILYKRYHAHERLSYSEMLLINVTLLLSTWYDLNDGTFLKKDHLDAKQEEQLQTVEDNTLLNAMYHYHKVSLVCDGIKTVQGLLLLYQHIKAKISGEVAYNIFCIAVRFAQEIGLSRKETYQSLDSSEALQRLAIWYYCVSEDSQLSLSFCKPPLINNDDTDVLTDEFYMEFITEYLVPQMGSGVSNSASLKTLEQNMADLLNHEEFVLFAVSYYSNLLSRITHKIYRFFFSVNSMNGRTFDEVVDRIIEVKKELRTWEKNLPYSLSLETYKRHLSMLESKCQQGAPGLGIEELSAHILSLHYQCFYMVIVVNLFACSFFLDNKGTHHLSRYDIAEFVENYKNQTGDLCVKMLLLWKNVNVIPNMRHALLYNFITGAFVLLLTLIKYSDDVRAAEHIKILIGLYDHLVDNVNLRLLTDSIKWNVSMFVYTFLLTLGIKCFNQKNPLASSYQFSTVRYEAKFDELTEKCENIKNSAVAQLKEYLDKYSATHCNPSQSPIVPVGEPYADNVSRFLNIFSELDLKDLESLASSLPLHLSCDSCDISSLNGICQKNKVTVPSTFDQSALTGKYDDESIFPESYRTGFTPNTDPSILAASLGTNMLSSDPCDFEQLLDNMLFDRDFSLPSNSMQKGI